MARSGARIKTQTDAAFTPAEVAKITEVSPELQRDWRRRKLLRPNQRGHARYEPHVVAELMVMKLLAQHKVGPSQTHKMSKRLSRDVLWHAFSNCDGALEIEGEPELVANFRRELKCGPDDLLMAIAGVKMVPTSFAVIDRNGKCIQTGDDHALAGAIREQGEGAVVVVDLDWIARRLAKRAGRALVTIKL